MPDILQIKITLQRTASPIWRRILVENTRTFLELHHIIQVVMGWQNSHLFQFIVNGHKITEPDEDLDLELGEKSVDASKARLGDFIKGEKVTFEYEYDFGDGWMHQIVVEKFLPREKKTKYPICLDGRLNCPPEDCGGIGGFYGMLEIIGSKGYPERKEMLQWLGGKYDAEHFDKDIVNIELAAIDQ